MGKGGTEGSVAATEDDCGGTVELFAEAAQDTINHAAEAEDATGKHRLPGISCEDVWKCCKGRIGQRNGRKLRGGGWKGCSESMQSGGNYSPDESRSPLSQNHGIEGAGCAEVSRNTGQGGISGNGCGIGEAICAESFRM